VHSYETQTVEHKTLYMQGIYLLCTVVEGSRHACSQNVQATAGIVYIVTGKRRIIQN
jgi:hypothetical protein